MGMRITTSMMMNTYRYNLQGSTSNLSDARNKVLTQRKFTSYAEDPSAATQAWRIRRAMSSNFDYQANNSDTYSRFNIASTTMGVVSNKLTDAAGRVSAIRGLNGAIGAGRQPLGKVLIETANTVIQAMNSAKYGDHFVFSGDDEMNPPFTWDGDILLYRGINVGAGAVPRPTMEPDWGPTKPDWANNPIDMDTRAPEGMPVKGSDDYEALDQWEKDWVDYYTDRAKDTPDGVKKPDEVPKNMPVEVDDDYKTSTEYGDLDTWEKAWVDYYMDQIQTPPAGIAKPTEVPEWTNSKLVDGMPEDVPPEDKRSAWDDLWVKYFEEAKGNPDAKKPTLDPSEADTDKWGTKDVYGIPANVNDILKDPNASATDKAWAEYFIDQGDVRKLEILAKEEQNVDLGMGLKEDDTGLVMGTAFNRSLPGINMLGGYGVDEDGDPRNAVLIMKRLGEIFYNSDPDSGDWPEEKDATGVEAEAYRLLNKLNASHNVIVENYADLEARAQFLQQNQTRLETQGDYLQEERLNLEQVDLADAITEFSWDYYCYSAALKIGTQLLSQSLLDYMS